jgi:alanine dehydrogenase
MKIGIPKEIKDQEYRVGATPEMTRALVEAGHEVLIETTAGAKIGYIDEHYLNAGGQIVETAKEVYTSEMIVKVKEPQVQEVSYMHEGQIIFSYLHLAAEPELTKLLLEKKVIAIAYETITDDQERLPLLTPMSEMAGRIAPQAGAVTLQMSSGGRGVLLGGVPGVRPGNVVIIGGGIVGTESAKMAIGLGADVTILDNNLFRLRYLSDMFGSRLKTLYSTTHHIERIVPDADLLIGSVLIPGKKAPKLVTGDVIKKMAKGSVVVDVAIDQGGCFETSKPTTHSSPTYIKDGVVHYCVTNMPGAYAFTSTEALTHATFNYVMTLANKGYMQAILDDKHIKAGLNLCQGHVTYSAVAIDLGYDYISPDESLCSLNHLEII